MRRRYFGSRRCVPTGVRTSRRLAVWHDDAMYFCTGPDERKAKNLKQNAQCILTTGQNGLDGLDVVVEGQAFEVGDAAELELLTNAYESKYGAHFTAPEGTWFGLSDAIRARKVLLYRVTPTTILARNRLGRISEVGTQIGALACIQ